MAFQIVIHLLITGMWMILNESYTFGSFLIGLLIGAILLITLQKFLPSDLYLKRIYYILKLLIIFLRELILSNIEIVKLVYQRKPTFEPGIFKYPLTLEKNWEITLLANLITLTPGTLSVAISEDQQTIYIHAMHIDTIEESISDIKNTFEKAIMEVTR